MEGVVLVYTTWPSIVEAEKAVMILKTRAALGQAVIGVYSRPA